MEETTHSCGYFCTKPACVLAQRNELREKVESLSKRRASQQIAGLEAEVARLKDLLRQAGVTP